MRRIGHWHRGRGVLLAVALAGTMAACARTEPAPVVYGATAGNAARGQAGRIDAARLQVGRTQNVPIPALRPARPVAQRVQPASGRHLVTVGETVQSIALRYSVPTQTVIDENRLSPPFAVVPGQMLVLPVARDYQVARGDTLFGVSRAFNVDVASLVRANDLAPPYLLYVGQTLHLPAPGETQVAAATAAGDDSQPFPQMKPTDAQATAVAAAGPPADPPPRAGSSFLWPVRGRVVSRYGAKPGGLHNDGVNIAAERGAPVRAAENGVVVYVGNELKGFGNLVLIRHDGGWVSAYAHADELLVEKGATVERGQTIARVGSSGAVDAPQLHFELRRGARTVDPLQYLDTRQAARGPADGAGSRDGFEVRPT